MLSLSPVKILIIVVVAIILLGPDKLPQFARQVGDTWRSFRALQRKMEESVRDSLPDLPSTSEIARLARSPASLLDKIAKYDPQDPDGEFTGDESEFGPHLDEDNADSPTREAGPARPRPDYGSGDPGLN